MNKIKGIRFPEKIIEVITNINNKLNVYIFKFNFLIEEKVIKAKNKYKENLCINPPAIASSINGPVFLYSKGLGWPNKFLPEKN